MTACKDLYKFLNPQLALPIGIEILALDCGLHLVPNSMRFQTGNTVPLMLHGDNWCSSACQPLLDACIPGSPFPASDLQVISFSCQSFNCTSLADKQFFARNTSVKDEEEN
jgi:hypothetical protein